MIKVAENLELDLKLDQIPDKYQWLAELIGIPQLLALCKAYGGGPLYLPEYDTLIKKALYDQIKKEANTHTVRELSKKYNITIRWVQNIIKGIPMEGQLTIFDMLK